VLGDEDAAVVVAAILQRGEAIKSPGGYLRNLTERARAGQFSIGPVLMSLLRTRTSSRRRA
jgi:replication initiation protein RepC